MIRFDDPMLATSALMYVPFLGVIAGSLLLLIVLTKRGHREAVQSFCARSSTVDEEFLRACEIPQDDFQVKIALIARRIIAELGTVPPESIRAEDSFRDDLNHLPFWDSLDWLDYVFRVEKAAGIKIPRGGFEEAASLACGPGSTLRVRHIVKATVLAAMRSRALNTSNRESS